MYARVYCVVCADTLDGAKGLKGWRPKEELRQTGGAWKGWRTLGPGGSIIDGSTLSSA